MSKLDVLIATIERRRIYVSFGNVKCTLNMIRRYNVDFELKLDVHNSTIMLRGNYVSFGHVKYTLNMIRRYNVD